MINDTYTYVSYSEHEYLKYFFNLFRLNQTNFLLPSFPAICGLKRGWLGLLRENL